MGSFTSKRGSPKGNEARMDHPGRVFLVAYTWTNEKCSVCPAVRSLARLVPTYGSPAELRSGFRTELPVNQ